MGYPKEVYDGAWSALSQRAQAARELADSRREEVHSAIPEIARIERELSATAASVARAVIASPDSTADLIAGLRDENLALQQRRRELLNSGGFPEDYLDAKYACERCRDTGYVGPEMCDCLRGLLKKEAYAQLGAVSGSGAYTFDAFSLRYYPDSSDAGGVVPRERMGQVLNYCRSYAEKFTRDSDSLMLIGRTGLGKTHLSIAIAAAVTERGYGVIYSSAQKLMDRLEYGKFARDTENRESYIDNMDYVLGCDLLVLDDLGTEFYTQFTAAILFNIINTRMIENRPTIINTNLELAQIEEKYSQRMVSRLICAYRVIKFFGKDIRFIRKSESL